jgi:hypothetical protein
MKPGRITEVVHYWRESAGRKSRWAVTVTVEPEEVDG